MYLKLLCFKTFIILLFIIIVKNIMENYYYFKYYVHLHSYASLLPIQRAVLHLKLLINYLKYNT